MQTQFKKAEALLAYLERSKNISFAFGEISPVLLLEKEIYFKDKIINLLRKSYENTEVTFGDEIDVDKAQNIFSGGGLFFSQRLLVVHQAEKIPKENSAVVKFIEEFINGGGGKDCLFLSNERSINSKIQKAISSRGKTIQCWPLFDSQVRLWLFEKSKAMNLRLSGQAVDALLRKKGSNLTQQEHALEVLKNLLKKEMKSPGNSITDTLVEKTFPQTNQITIFEFLDRVFEGNFNLAIICLHSLLNSGNPLPYLFAMLSKEITRLYRAKILELRGVDIEKILKTESIPKMQTKSFFSKLKNYSLEKIDYAIKRLAKIDQLMKSSRSFTAIAELESLIFRISQM